MATQNLSANELRDYAKFNGINFPQWRYGVMLKLRRKKLEKLVLGQDPKPAETFNDANGVTNQDVIDNWIERDTDACSIIYYNIEPTYQTSIEGSATSAEMWNRLAQEYAQVAVANSSQLTAKFFQYLMDPGHTVSAHVNRMRQMAEELKSVEAPVTDQQLIERILQTLPPSYYNFISAWESVPLAERSISSLTSRLILEETRMKSRTNGPNPADIAFFASHPNNKQQQAIDCNSENAYAASKSYNGGRGGYPGLRGNRGSSLGYRGGYRGGNNGFRGRGFHRGPSFDQIYCWACNQPGHKSFTCRNKGRNEEQRSSRQNKFDNNRNLNNDNNGFSALSSFCFVARKPTDWYADSGATHHMSEQRHFFTTFKEVPQGTWHVNGIGSAQLSVLGVGKIQVYSLVDGERKEGELTNVLFVPGLGTNLFSIGAATEVGITAHFIDNDVYFKKNSKDVMVGQRLGQSLYHLKIVAKNPSKEVSATTAVKAQTSLTLWHQRLAHLNNKIILKMISSNSVNGLTLKKENLEHGLCEGCIFGKMHRSPFPTGRSRAKEVGDIIHSDVGFVNVPTPNGETCFVLFKDDFSGWTKVYLMKSKSEADDNFLKFVAFLEATTGKKVKILRTDQGVEYKKNRSWREERGIIHQTTNRYTPQQNGVSERLNRTAMESTRSALYMSRNNPSNLLMKSNKRVLELWGEFLRSSIYVLNRTLSSSSTKTPFELFYKKKPNLDNLRVIGCRAYAHIPDCLRKKLDPKAVPCWLVGYNEEIKGWKLWEPVSRKFITSRDVIFNEDLLINDFDGDEEKLSESSLFDPLLLTTEILGLLEPIHDETQEVEEMAAANVQDQNGVIHHEVQPVGREDEAIVENDAQEILHAAPLLHVEMEEENDDQHSGIMENDPLIPINELDEDNEIPAQGVEQPIEFPRRSSRPKQYNARYKEFRQSLGRPLAKIGLIETFINRHASALFIEAFEPQNYQQALASPESEKWMEAYRKEFNSLMENKTWELVLLPPGCTAINCKMIGKLKPAYEGVPEVYKGRLVAIGSRQRYGIDYDETFAPVPHSEAVKATLAEIASLDLEMIQFDIKTAFLYAKLDKSIYMKQPEGFVVTGKENFVCKLNKSLYGLKQAPRLWFKRFDDVLLKFGLKNSAADRCVYVRRTEDETTFGVIHVDDSIFGSNKPQVLIDIRSHLGEEFQIHSLPPTRFIGINIKRDRLNKRIFMSQQHVIEKLVARFGFQDVKPKAVPADPNVRLRSHLKSKSEGEKIENYRETVGALLYLALQTRPDLAYAVGQVARYCQNPKVEHWQAVLQIFGYLNGTKDYGIWVGGERTGLVGYSDADFAGDVNDRKSTSGSIFFFHGGPVAWASKKQPCTALSTTEAEYISACEAAKTAVWLSYLLQDFTGEEQKKVPLYCDNQGAVRLVYNAEFHQRTKHIQLRWHWIREQAANEIIEVKFVGTENQLADIFTKALAGPIFHNMRRRIGVGKLSD